MITEHHTPPATPQQLLHLSDSCTLRTWTGAAHPGGPGTAAGPESHGKGDMSEWAGDQAERTLLHVGVEGQGHSPRNRCTACTASASSTTSDRISHSRARCRAWAATVLAPRLLATLQHGSRGELRQGLLYPTQRQPSSRPIPQPQGCSQLHSTPHPTCAIPC